jgi:peptidoglycan/xylan/chitin deacetylase (PgdA/CDA1 family)
VRRVFGVRDRIPSGGRVALTFDDGPHPRGTPETLRILDAAGARATFFLVGEQVRRDPALAREIAAAGHTVAVHADRHRNLLRLTPRQVRDDLLRAEATIADAVGAPAPLYRPPYGVLTSAGVWHARSRRWEIVLWARWGRDWRARATPSSIAREAADGLRGGEIILLHDSDAYSSQDSWTRTTAALPLILRRIADAGLTVTDLQDAAPRNPDELVARVEAASRREQRFAREAGHQLRTPVAALRARAELALAARGPDAGPEHEAALRAVVDDAERLNTAIDDLLAMAHRELGPSPGSVDLAALASEVPGVEVALLGSVPLAEGEPDVIRRALAALVDNARRHARERVTLEVGTGFGRVYVAVRDDGPGLDHALGDGAFEPGIRGAGAAPDAAGLGLAFARRIARSCGGNVEIGPGPGGCFVLDLPAIGP